LVKKLWTALIVGAAVAGSSFVALDAGANSAGPVSPAVKVWTEPQSGYGFLQDVIKGAHRTIDISMYELSDKTTENDLIARARAGVIVRVLLNSAYYGRTFNAPAAALLRAGAVHVAWAPSGQIFHAKYVVVDNHALYLGTGNLVTSDYSSTRDFWVEDTTARDVTAATATFNADFSHDKVAPQNAGGLVWSPGSTSALVSLINSSRSTLLVENEEMDNVSIEQALTAAARRGVSVKVVMTYSSEWTSALAQLKDAGVKVSKLGASQIHIHAKVICADCTPASGTVFIGSENFSTSSLSYNRELGVLTTSSIAVRAVGHAVAADYAVGRAGS
jgi:cardiolipin synthase